MGLLYASSRVLAANIRPITSLCFTGTCWNLWIRVLAATLIMRLLSVLHTEINTHDYSIPVI